MDSTAIVGADSVNSSTTFASVCARSAASKSILRICPVRTNKIIIVIAITPHIAKRFPIPNIAANGVQTIIPMGVAMELKVASKEKTLPNLSFGTEIWIYVR